MKKMKKVGAIALSIVFAMSLCIPIASFAESSSADTSGNASNAAEAAIGAMETSRGVDDQADGEASMMGLPSSTEIAETVSIESVLSSDEIQAEAPIETTPPANDCTATIMYYENVTYEEPGVKPNEQNRYFLGKRTITGLTEGEVLNAWDYVVKIDGFVFFDGWPGNLVVSANPDENVFEFFYFRLWDSAYTVNYYLMEGADLSADTWGEALAGDVTFTKFASETIVDQPYGALVEGDAYEYEIDGTYVVDTYPAQIRVGSDAEEDVINVLYVPTLAVLPDDVEMMETAIPPTSDSGGGSGGSTGSDSGSVTVPGDSGSISGNVSSGNSSPVSSSTGNIGAPSSSSRPSLPADQTFTREEIVELLPDSEAGQEVTELFHDFIDATNEEGELEITDEMLENPMTPAQARMARAAFDTGYDKGLRAGEGDAFPIASHVVCALLILIFMITTIIGFTLFSKERNRRKELEMSLEGDAGSGMSQNQTAS